MQLIVFCVMAYLVMMLFVSVVEIVTDILNRK